MLAAFGVATVAHLHPHRAALRHVFSPISCDFFWHAHLGLGSTMTPEKAAEGDVTRKGISCERTFAPISQTGELEAKLRDVAEHLSEDMAKESIAGKCITLKLKETTFQVRIITFDLGSTRRCIRCCANQHAGCVAQRCKCANLQVAECAVC